MISGFSFTYLLGPSKDNRYFLCGALNASKATSRRNRQPTCSAPDHGLGMAGPIYSVGVVRSISFWKCHRAPTVWLPELTQGCRYSLALGSKPPLINRDIFSSIPSGLRRKNQKVFFMRSRPRLIDWRIDSSCTPSASAISLIDLPRMIYASILRPWISGRELRAFHRRRKVSIRSRSSCGVGSCRQAEYSIPSSQSREYCALCRESRRW